MIPCHTRRLFPVLAAAPGAAALMLACAGAQGPAARPGLEDLRAEGQRAAMAVLPVQLGGRCDRDVGDALGLILETQHGMANLVPSPAAFARPAGADWNEVAAALGRHVAAQPTGTDYALFAEVVGTPREGVSETRLAVVDKSGAVVLTDVATAADSDFRRALGSEATPMASCAFLASRLAAALDLPRGAAAETPGTFASLWQQKSGVPDRAELDAAATRLQELQALQAQRRGARLAVLPSRIGGRVDADSARRLASSLSEQLGLQALAVEEAPVLALQPTSNEQKVLWDFARAVRSHLQAQPSDAEYVLMADYGIDAETGERSTVHFVVCEGSGDWVLVDLQNSHHDDFQAIRPRSVADCDQLVVARLTGHLR